MTRRHSLKDYALLGLLALLWGVAYNFAKIAVETIPPLTMTALRFVIGAGLLAAILQLRGVRLVRADDPWSRLAVQAAVNNMLPWSLTAWAAVSIDSGLATILNSTSPIFAFLITWGITRHEAATPAKLFGALIGLAGVIAIVGTGVFKGGGGHIPQQIACVAGAMMFGIAAVHGRHLDTFPPLVVATLTLFIGAMVMVPLSLALDRPWTLSPSAASMTAMLGLGVLSTAAAMYLYYRILAAMGSIAVSSQSYLRIIVGVSVGIVFLGEQLTIERFLGMGLILAGVIAMTWPGANAAGRRGKAPAR